MSRLLVVTRPELVHGFQLAGVDAYGAEDVESAQELIDSWLVPGEVGLLAIDDGLLESMDPAVVRRLETSDRLPFLAATCMSGSVAAVAATTCAATRKASSRCRCSGSRATGADGCRVSQRDQRGNLSLNRALGPL